MAVPYTFGSATAAIPLSQLDSNFASTITLGNTAIQLGNTVTTLNNMTLANVTVSTGNVTVTSITDSGLTNTRVTYAGTGGLLQDSANLTFNGTTLTLAGISNSGNLTFTGTGNRITGDFTTGTYANRMMFQTSTTNSNTSVSAIPNGTATGAAFNTHNNSDPTNSGVFQLRALSTEMRLTANAVGTGTFLPMTFYTNNSERMRVSTEGLVSVGMTGGDATLNIGATVPNIRLYVSGTTLVTDMYASGSDTNINTVPDGNFIFGTNNTERMRIDSSGNVGIGTTSPNASAILDAQSTTKGVRFPNMTTTQKNAISSPAAGLVVFDTTLSKLCVYSGAAWQTITSV